MTDNVLSFGLLITRYSIQIVRVLVYMKRFNQRKKQMESIQKIDLKDTGGIVFYWIGLAVFLYFLNLDGLINLKGLKWMRKSKFWMYIYKTP